MAQHRGGQAGVKIIIRPQLLEVVIHGLVPADEGDGGHIVHRFDLALEGSGLILGEGVVHIGQKLVLRHELVQVVLDVDRHQGEAAGDQQAGGDDGDGGDGHETVAENAAEALPHIVAEVTALSSLLCLRLCSHRCRNRPPRH